MKTIPFVLFLFFFQQSLSMNLFNLVNLNSKTNATCMDGSNAGYYLWHPDETEKPVNKLLIHFQQTPLGWCTQQDLSSSINNCHRWMTSQNLEDETSTKNWETNFLPLTGILSPFDGGEFNMWTKVVIRSCDGGAFMGDRQPISYKGSKLHFKGTNIVRQIFQNLKDKKYFDNREEVVISGSMNGAVAALTYSTIIKEYTKSPVRVLVDSAIHLDYPNAKTNRSQFQSRMKNVLKLYLNDGNHPHQGCSKANSDEQWKCMFAAKLQEYVTEPIFFTQALYDGWSIAYILGFKCAEEFASLSQCTKTEREDIEQYEAEVRKVITSAANRTGNGAFAIACVAHQFLSGRFINDMFEIPMNSGNMAANITTNWINGNGTAVAIDKVDWPENKPCAYKAAYKSSANLKVQ